MSESGAETLEAPAEALARLLAALSPVGHGAVPLCDAAGGVLAEAVYADRDSPPQAVSSMDGYAMRRAQAVAGAVWPVTATARMGEAPPVLVEGAVVRVSTGAAVPAGAELIVRREDVEEAGERIGVRASVDAASLPLNIRRRGENTRAGAVVLAAGTRLLPPAVAAAAAMGHDWVKVHRRVRVGVLITGDEFAPPGGASPPPWKIRDSNGPAVAAWLSARTAFAANVTPDAATLHVADDPGATRAGLERLLAVADLVVTTGGVSMGDVDHVPGAVAAVGGRTVYHKLAMRPGKPNFAAMTADGRVIMGLPGNPVSVLCGLTRLVEPTLRHLAGLATPAARHRVAVRNPDDKTLHLWHYRPVRLSTNTPDAPGVPPGAAVAELLPVRGSGDLAGAAAADGFVEVPPHRPVGSGATYWPITPD